MCQSSQVLASLSSTRSVKNASTKISMLFGNLLPNSSNVLNLFVSSFRVCRLYWEIYWNRIFCYRPIWLSHVRRSDLSCLVYCYGIRDKWVGRFEITIFVLMAHHDCSIQQKTGWYLCTSLLHKPCHAPFPPLRTAKPLSLGKYQCSVSASTDSLPEIGLCLAVPRRTAHAVNTVLPRTSVRYFIVCEIQRKICHL